MEADRLNILWLDCFDFLTYSKKCQILKAFPKNEDIRKSFLSNPKLNEIVTIEEKNKMSLCLDPTFLNVKMEKYKNSNVICLTYYDEKYPYLLKQIDTPPLCLYCKGNLDLLDTICVGVVGTRRPTEYGIVTTKQYVSKLVEANITIVSGLATGIDTVAHTVTLEKQGQTIAVLAGGFNHIYPASNISLFNKMIESNLVITENNPDILPLQYLFPLRNRIIAGLSKAIFVPEAGKKSGSLHTVNYAIDYNRDVFALPGKINSPMSEGTNNIIKSLQASITTAPDDILSQLGIDVTVKQNQSVQIDLSVQKILDFIKTEKKSFQQIADFTGISAGELNTLLMELEMQDLIMKLPNNNYILS